MHIMRFDLIEKIEDWPGSYSIWNLLDVKDKGNSFVKFNYQANVVLEN